MTGLELVKEYTIKGIEGKYLLLEEGQLFFWVKKPQTSASLLNMNIEAWPSKITIWGS